MKLLTPIKAIRAKCMDCSCGDRKEVRECRIKTCSLWPYRLGKRPHSSFDCEIGSTHGNAVTAKPKGRTGI